MRLTSSRVQFQAMRISHSCLFGGIFVAFALLVPTAEAASQLNVVLTGDSITNAYQHYNPIVSPSSYFTDTGFDIQFESAAIPGINTEQYSGHAWTAAAPHDYAQDVANANPDYIVFMLGTNDLFNDNGWEKFQTYIPEIFGHWKNGPKVIVASILPQISVAANDLQINELYNPFLKQQAEDFSFSFLDTNSLLKENLNWKSYYYIDGVHLNAYPGYSWLAQTVCNSVKADVVSSVPEPTSLYLLVAGATCLLAYYSFLRRSFPTA